MTPFIKKKDIKKDWYIINAQDAAVGRLAAYISKVLRGKNKPTYNPHIDNGDFVVVTNIDKIKFSGKKFTDKKFCWNLCLLGRNETHFYRINVIIQIHAEKDKIVNTMADAMMGRENESSFPVQHLWGLCYLEIRLI